MKNYCILVKIYLYFFNFFLCHSWKHCLTGIKFVKFVNIEWIHWPNKRGCDRIFLFSFKSNPLKFSFINFFSKNIILYINFFSFSVFTWRSFIYKYQLFNFCVLVIIINLKKNNKNNWVVYLLIKLEILEVHASLYWHRYFCSFFFFFLLLLICLYVENIKYSFSWIYFDFIHPFFPGV